MREDPINELSLHYDDVMMGAMASQVTSLTIVYSTVYPDADQRKHQSCSSLAFVREIRRGPVNSPHKWPVTRKIFPFMTSSWKKCFPCTERCVEGYIHQTRRRNNVYSQFRCRQTPPRFHNNAYLYNVCHPNTLHQSIFNPQDWIPIKDTHHFST